MNFRQKKRKTQRSCLSNKNVSEAVVFMSSKQKILVSFAEKIVIMDSDYMAETAHRIKSQHVLICYQKRPHDNVLKLSSEKNVERIESPDPRQEMVNIHGRSGTNTYEGIVKNLEDMRTTMMDVG